jgi:hypothetical protein
MECFLYKNKYAQPSIILGIDGCDYPICRTLLGEIEEVIFSSGWICYKIDTLVKNGGPSC